MFESGDEETLSESCDEEVGGQFVALSLNVGISSETDDLAKLSDYFPL